MPSKKKAGKNTRKEKTKKTNASSRRIFAGLCIGGIVLVTFIVFYPSLKNDFVNWDDTEYVTEDPMVASDTLQLKEIFTKPVSGNYHPLTILSLALNYQSGALNPEGYHEENLIFHLLNTILAFIFIYLLTRRNLLIASIVALFFGIHPMHVESVAWISERKDVLYVFFFLCGLITYLHYRETKKMLWYYITVFLFILSCFSKGMAVVFPVILLLIDYLQNQDTRLKTQDLLYKIPFFVITIIIGIVTYHTQQVDLTSKKVTFTVMQRFIFACYGMVMYPVKLLLPVHLSSFYRYPIEDKSGTIPFVFYLPLLALVVIIPLVYFFLRKDKNIMFGLLFYVATIALVIKVIPLGEAIIADRYSYLSYIGLLFVFAYTVNAAWTAGSGFMAGLKYPLAIITLFAAVTFSYGANARIAVWKNGETLWTDVISKNPNVYAFYDNLGEYYASVKENDKALESFNRTLELKPDFAEAYNDRGNIYKVFKKYDLALADYKKCLMLDSTIISVYKNRAGVYEKLKEYDKAINDITKAISLGANDEQLYARCGRDYYYINRFDKAVSFFSIYLKKNPENTLIHELRGLCYENLGRHNEAILDYTRAIELNPSVPGYWHFRSQAENSLGKKEDAKADSLKALELGKPADSDLKTER